MKNFLIYICPNLSLNSYWHFWWINFSNIYFDASLVSIFFYIVYILWTWAWKHELWTMNCFRRQCGDAWPGKPHNFLCFGFLKCIHFHRQWRYNVKKKVFGLTIGTWKIAVQHLSTSICIWAPDFLAFDINWVHLNVWKWLCTIKIQLFSSVDHRSFFFVFCWPVIRRSYSQYIF